MECWRSNVRYPMRDPETGQKFDRYRRTAADSVWVEGIMLDGVVFPKAATMERIGNNLNGGLLVVCADEMAKAPYDFLKPAGGTPAIQKPAGGTPAIQKPAGGTPALQKKETNAMENTEKPPAVATAMPCPPSELTLGAVDHGKALTHVNEEIARAARALVLHVQKYGSKVSKASSTVNVKVAIGYEEGEYLVLVECKTLTPGELPKCDFLSVVEMRNGVPTLAPSDFAPADDVPGQEKLTFPKGE